MQTALDLSFADLFALIAGTDCTCFVIKEIIQK